MKEMKQKFTQFIHIAIITILMTSCASGKIVLSNDANISKWKIQCKLPPKTKRFCPLVLK